MLPVVGPAGGTQFPNNFVTDGSNRTFQCLVGSDRSVGSGLYRISPESDELNLVSPGSVNGLHQISPGCIKLVLDQLMYSTRLVLTSVRPGSVNGLHQINPDSIKLVLDQNQLPKDIAKIRDFIIMA